TRMPTPRRFRATSKAAVASAEHRQHAAKPFPRGALAGEREVSASGWWARRSDPPTACSNAIGVQPTWLSAVAEVVGHADEETGARSPTMEISGTTGAIDRQRT